LTGKLGSGCDGGRDCISGSWTRTKSMVRSVFFNQGSTELHGSTGDCRGFHRNRPKFETTVLYAVAAIDISIIA